MTYARSAAEAHQAAENIRRRAEQGLNWANEGLKNMGHLIKLASQAGYHAGGNTFGMKPPVLRMENPPKLFSDELDIGATLFLSPVSMTSFIMAWLVFPWVESFSSVSWGFSRVVDVLLPVGLKVRSTNPDNMGSHCLPKDDKRDVLNKAVYGSPGYAFGMGLGVLTLPILTPARMICESVISGTVMCNELYTHLQDTVMGSEIEKEFHKKLGQRFAEENEAADKSRSSLAQYVYGFPGLVIGAAVACVGIVGYCSITALPNSFNAAWNVFAPEDEKSEVDNMTNTCYTMGGVGTIIGTIFGTLAGGIFVGLPRLVLNSGETLARNTAYVLNGFLPEEQRITHWDESNVAKMKKDTRSNADQRYGYLGYVMSLATFPVAVTVGIIGRFIIDGAEVSGYAWSRGRNWAFDLGDKLAEGADKKPTNKPNFLRKKNPDGTDNLEYQPWRYGTGIFGFLFAGGLAVAWGSAVFMGRVFWNGIITSRNSTVKSVNFGLEATGNSWTWGGEVALEENAKLVYVERDDTFGKANHEGVHRSDSSRYYGRALGWTVGSILPVIGFCLGGFFRSMVYSKRIAGPAFSVAFRSVLEEKNQADFATPEGGSKSGEQWYDYICKAPGAILGCGFGALAFVIYGAVKVAVNSAETTVRNTSETINFWLSEEQRFTWLDEKPEKPVNQLISCDNPEVNDSSQNKDPENSVSTTEIEKKVYHDGRSDKEKWFGAPLGNSLGGIFALSVGSLIGIPLRFAMDSWEVSEYAWRTGCNWAYDQDDQAVVNKPKFLEDQPWRKITGGLGFIIAGSSGFAWGCLVAIGRFLKNTFITIKHRSISAFNDGLQGTGKRCEWNDQKNEEGISTKEYKLDERSEGSRRYGSLGDGYLGVIPAVTAAFVAGICRMAIFSSRIFKPAFASIFHAALEEKTQVAWKPALSNTGDSYYDNFCKAPGASVGWSCGFVSLVCYGMYKAGVNGLITAGLNTVRIVNALSPETLQWTAFKKPKEVVVTETVVEPQPTSEYSIVPTNNSEEQENLGENHDRAEIDSATPGALELVGVYDARSNKEKIFGAPLGHGVFGIPAIGLGFTIAVIQIGIVSSVKSFAWTVTGLATAPLSKESKKAGNFQYKNWSWADVPGNVIGGILALPFGFFAMAFSCAYVTVRESWKAGVHNTSFILSDYERGQVVVKEVPVEEEDNQKNSDKNSNGDDKEDTLNVNADGDTDSSADSEKNPEKHGYAKLSIANCIGAVTGGVVGGFAGLFVFGWRSMLRNGSYVLNSVLPASWRINLFDKSPVAEEMAEDDRIARQRRLGFALGIVGFFGGVVASVIVLSFRAVSNTWKSVNEVSGYIMYGEAPKTGGKDAQGNDKHRSDTMRNVFFIPGIIFGGVIFGVVGRVFVSGAKSWSYMHNCIADYGRDHPKNPQLENYSGWDYLMGIPGGFLGMFTGGCVLLGTIIKQSWISFVTTVKSIFNAGLGEVTNDQGYSVPYFSGSRVEDNRSQLKRNCGLPGTICAAPFVIPSVVIAAIRGLPKVVQAVFCTLSFTIFAPCKIVAKGCKATTRLLFGWNKTRFDPASDLEDATGVIPRFRNLSAMIDSSGRFRAGVAIESSATGSKGMIRNLGRFIRRSANANLKTTEEILIDDLLKDYRKYRAAGNQENSLRYFVDINQNGGGKYLGFQAVIDRAKEAYNKGCCFSENVEAKAEIDKVAACVREYMLYGSDLQADVEQKYIDKYQQQENIAVAIPINGRTSSVGSATPTEAVVITDALYGPSAPPLSLSEQYKAFKNTFFKLPEARAVGNSNHDNATMVHAVVVPT